MRVPRRARDIAKRVLNLAWSLGVPRKTNRCIYYHSVHPVATKSHDPNVFREQLRWLRTNGYKSILAKQVPDYRTAKKGQWVCISFDDGYLDNAEIALPILLQEGFVATVFVVTGMVGRDDSSVGHRLYPGRPMLDKARIRSLADAGIEIGSHTVSHHMATRLSPEQFYRELLDSKKFLEDVIGKPVRSFSYPNGQRGAFSTETRKMLVKAGYEVAFTTLWGSVGPNCDPLTMPRCEIAAEDSIEDFAAKMLGQRDYLVVIHRMFDGSWAQ